MKMAGGEFNSDRYRPIGKKPDKSNIDRWFTVYMVIIGVVSLALAVSSIWMVVLIVQALLKYLGS